jgi:proline utilization trans-activator
MPLTALEVHLGKSSNWSFGRRVLRMTCDRLGVELPTENLHFQGSVYRLDWQVLRHRSEPSAHALPAPDYGIYLINATKFHCGQIFHLFDEEEFMRNFTTFNEHKNGIDRVSQSWYVHYMLVLAFGKAFVARNAQEGRPPGADLFLEAMRHLPEITLFSDDSVDTDSIESIEILICAALYLQSLDFRAAAYNLVCFAPTISVNANSTIDWPSFEESPRARNAHADGTPWLE